MNKDTLVANTITLGSISMTFMDIIPIITVVSLSSAVILNLILIRKNLFNEKK